MQVVGMQLIIQYNINNYSLLFANFSIVLLGQFIFLHIGYTYTAVFTFCIGPLSAYL